ncbi:MAG: DNA methyltransferase, partial [Promethearchaeota archaeon]
MSEKKTNKKNARKDMKLDQLNQINIMDSKTKNKKVPAQENNGASMQNEPRETREILIKTLKELFQFDKNDLDFGIYRILNIKRREIKRFIEKDLFEIISSEIKIFDNSNDLSKKLSDLQNEIETTFGCGIEEALNNNPRAPKVLEYMRIKSELEQKGNKVELEEEIFDHLINFFSRYYDNGDFISKRRYSGENSYVIPYNGEEIYLYWANHDQYYIKTAENFRNYTFKAGDWSINFEIAEEDVSIEKANIKDPEKKYFIYHDLKVVGNNVNIYFGYRGLTDEEKKSILEQSKKKTITRETVNLYNLNEIRGNVLISPIKELYKKHERLDGTISNRTELEWHLDKYTTKNISDYFIHKNLKGFLSRELDFYIKNEILDIDKISSEMDLKRTLKLIKVFKGIALMIIDFLSQIEEFQKRLWEKKKFVLSTDYLITLDYIDEKYYPEILKNSMQLNWWKDILKFEIKTSNKDLEKTLLKYSSTTDNNPINILKAHKTLVINTRFFSTDFKYKILSEIKGLSDKITGLLIHSENFQGLALLSNKYNSKIDLVYLDPPYNTGNDEFIYKDRFKHSSWLSMMNELIKFFPKLGNDMTTFFISIDNNELTHL